MKLTSAIRRTGRGDARPLYAVAALAMVTLLAAAPTLAYTSTGHNLTAALATWAAIVLVATTLLCRNIRRAQAQAAAEQARAEARWAYFIASFPAAVRPAVTVLADDTNRAATFAEVGLAPAAIATGRSGDHGMWPTERGAVVRLAGIDPDAFTRASAALAQALDVPTLTVRRTRRRDGACELHLSA